MTAVELHPALLDVQDVADHGVEEVPVVGDHQQGAAVALQPAFQPQHRIQVQVVGGLVQQQQVGAAHQGPRQVETDAPAAGEFLHRPGEVGIGEAQAVQQFGRPGLGPVTADLAVAGMQGGDALAVVGGFRHLEVGLHLAQLPVPIQGEFQGRVRQGGRLLGDVGDDPAGGQIQVAALGVQGAAEEGEEGGLAAAVAAGEAYLVSGMELQAGVADQGLAGAGEGEIAED